MYRPQQKDGRVSGSHAPEESLLASSGGRRRLLRIGNRRRRRRASLCLGGECALGRVRRVRRVRRARRARRAGPERRWWRGTHRRPRQVRKPDYGVSFGRAILSFPALLRAKIVRAEFASGRGSLAGGAASRGREFGGCRRISGGRWATAGCRDVVFEPGYWPLHAGSCVPVPFGLGCCRRCRRRGRCIVSRLGRVA